MLFWATMVLQLNVASLGLRTLSLLSPFVSGDAVHDEEDEVGHPIATDQYPASSLFSSKGAVTYSISAKNTLAAISTFPIV